MKEFKLSRGSSREFRPIPFYNVETGDSVLSPNSVQITAEDGYAHTGTTGARRSHVAAPLVRLGIVSGRVIRLLEM